jgi:MFS transporter, OFA family, oxalate/formate antiporter
MTPPLQRVPGRAWVVTFAGTAVNLCLGILYAWSVWKNNLIGNANHPAGSAMTGLDEGWTYLTKAEGTWAYAVCGFVFALCMIPAGRLQDKFGPKIGTTAGGLFLAGGCILSGLMKNYVGLILGFGIMGGIGMGLAYAATTPAAVKWFGPHKRGLIVGLVVGGYGGAAVYISPVGEFLIANYGLSGSFIGFGILFALVIVVAGQLLSWPPPGYVPPGAPSPSIAAAAMQSRVDWPAPAVLKTWQFYGLVFLFFCSAQSGLLIIANATPILNNTAKTIAFLAANAWILSSYGGIINATGRIGTGRYSDKIGRLAAYRINGAVCALFLFLMPYIMGERHVPLLFLAIGIAYWQYGGGLALLPALTADFFGSKNLGLNYGLVFIGWGFAFFIPQAAGYIEDWHGNLDLAFYISGGLLTLAVLLSFFLGRPEAAQEK